MKPTQITELFANIKKTFVSFFSILMFVALGVGIFLGISWAGPALQNAADSEFDKGAFHHFQMQYVYGFTDDDLAKLAEVEGVTDIEPTRQSFQTLEASDSSEVTVKVHTLTERIDVPVVLEGELPAKANEIALNEVAARAYGFEVGDTITFLSDASADDEDLSSLLANSGQGDAASASGASGAAASESAKPVDKDGMKYLNGSTYKVTALVNSPEYIARSSSTYGFSNAPSGGVNLLAWVPASAFDPSAFQNGYPVVNIACDGLAGWGTFTDDYAKQSAGTEERLTELGDSLADARFDELYSKAEKQIQDAEQKLNDAKNKIKEGEQQIADGRAELEKKKAEGEAKLADGYQTLMYYEGVKSQGEAKIAEGREILAIVDKTKASASAAIDKYEGRWSKATTAEEKQQIVNDAQKELNAALEPLGVPAPTITVDNFEPNMAEARDTLAHLEETPVPYAGETRTVAQWRQRLAEAESQYNDAVVRLNEGWATYYAGWDELNRLAAEGEQKLVDGQKQVDDAKKQVAENEPKLKKAKDLFATMERGKCAVMSRTYNAGAVEISTFSDVTGNLSISMAALFIIVGLLVSYSAVSRIVHEQVTQIGTKKALGLRAREITTSFLAYSAIAVVAGAIIGTIVGILLVEGIIGHVLAGMFTFGDYPPYFGLVLFLIVTLLELALVLGATYLACRGILKEHAVELLKGEKPPQGKTRFYEKWGIWGKLPLLTQTIVNNCVNDKRRVFSTVVGVAGCTALIVTAITLNNDVLASYDRHYENVYGFNAIAYVDPSVDDVAANAEKVLEEQGASASPVLRKGFVLDQPDGGRSTMRLIVPADASEFAEAYHVNPVSGSSLNLSDEGAWVSQAYAEHFGAKVGDTLKFEDTSGAVYEVPILGIHEFWLTYHEVIMGRDYYEKLFTTTYEPNVVLANTHGANVADIGKALEGVNGYSSIADDKTYQHGNFETFASVSSAVVLIYIALSVLMAIVVLLNLNVMFIEEKKRELIVLMINGFSTKDAKRYIYNDTIVLTAIGIILGILLGCIMGSITVGAIEPSTAAFIKSPDPMAIIVGIVGSAVLAAIMSFISLRRIPKFDLTDINKF